MLKAYKYRIYPNQGQREILEKYFGCCRYVYNWGLGIKKSLYEETKKSLSKKDLQTIFVNELKKDKEWLQEVNSQSLLNTLWNLDSAYQRFFREKKGFPQFKSKKDNHYSFQCPQFTTLNVENSTLDIVKIKGIPIRLHRMFQGAIKTTTISKTASEKYFAGILVDSSHSTIVPTAKIEANTTIGIDTGIKSFLVCSNSSEFENNKYLAKNLRRLKLLQRRHQRKKRIAKVLDNGKTIKRNSNNREKSRLKIARLHESISNQRLDYLHQITHKLTHDSQVKSICVEDLNVKGLLRNSKLARSLSDVGIGKFYEILAYKCEWYGINLVKIGRFEASSKTCSCCGYIKRDLSLSDRFWTCTERNTQHDRDVNASINIKNFGLQKALGLERPKVKSVECPLVDDRLATNLKSNDIMKQKKRRAFAPKPLSL